MPDEIEIQEPCKRCLIEGWLVAFTSRILARQPLLDPPNGFDVARETSSGDNSWPLVGATSKPFARQHRQTRKEKHLEFAVKQDDGGGKGQPEVAQYCRRLRPTEPGTLVILVPKDEQGREISLWPHIFRKAPEALSLMQIFPSHGCCPNHSETQIPRKPRDQVCGRLDISMPLDDDEAFHVLNMSC